MALTKDEIQQSIAVANEEMETNKSRKMNLLPLLHCTVNTWAS